MQLRCSDLFKQNDWWTVEVNFTPFPAPPPTPSFLPTPPPLPKPFCLNSRSSFRIFSSGCWTTRNGAGHIFKKEHHNISHTNKMLNWCWLLPSPLIFMHLLFPVIILFNHFGLIYKTNKQTKRKKRHKCEGHLK